MEDNVDNGLDKVLKELATLKQQQKDLLSEYRGREVSSKSVDSVSETRSEFIIPNADGLDPERAVKLFIGQFQAQGGKLPDNVKRVLNPYQIEAGDLILVRPQYPDTLSVFGRIKWSQAVEMQRKLSGVYDKACFTHAAISNGYHKIYESVPENGVVRTGYWRYMTGGYEVKVKRLKGLDWAQRRKISLNVSRVVGVTQDFVDLSAIKMMSQEQEWLHNIPACMGGDDAYICSALFAAACHKEKVNLNLPSYGEEVSVVTPAKLNLSDALEDVEAQWVSVA